MVASAKHNITQCSTLGGAVVEWWRSRPLDCEVLGSNFSSGQKFETRFLLHSPPQRWWRRVTRAGLGHKTPLYKTWIAILFVADDTHLAILMATKCTQSRYLVPVVPRIEATPVTNGWCHSKDPRRSSSPKLTKLQQTVYASLQISDSITHQTAHPSFCIDLE